jgi:hypothetical protein
MIQLAPCLVEKSLAFMDRVDPLGPITCSDRFRSAPKPRRGRLERIPLPDGHNPPARIECALSLKRVGYAG